MGDVQQSEADSVVIDGHGYDIPPPTTTTLNLSLLLAEVLAQRAAEGADLVSAFEVRASIIHECDVQKTRKR